MTEFVDLKNRYRTHPEMLGIEIDSVNTPGAVDDAMIHLAARVGNIEDVEALVNLGAPVNAKGDLGHTPLHYAAALGHVRLVERLLQIGADPQLKNEFDETPGDVALSRHPQIAKLLPHR